MFHQHRINRWQLRTTDEQNVADQRVLSTLDQQNCKYNATIGANKWLLSEFGVHGP